MRTLLTAAALLAASAQAPAMEWKDIRIGPQVLLGTSGFEPGVFAEFTWDALRLRPELFLHDRDRPGAGVSLLWRLPLDLLPAHTLHIGPRVAYHNGDRSDDPRGEVSAMGIYNLPIPPKNGDSRHHLEIIAALGLVDEDGTEAAASAGAGYVFRF
jgi:hypothetical protein